MKYQPTTNEYFYTDIQPKQYNWWIFNNRAVFDEQAMVGYKPDAKGFVEWIESTFEFDLEPNHH